MEHIIVNQVGQQLDDYIKLFDNLKKVYVTIDDKSITLFCLNLQQYFDKIKVNNNLDDTFKKLTDCNYMK